MPQNNMPLNTGADPFDEIVRLVVYARDNEMPQENRIIYLQEAIIRLAEECRLMRIGQSNIARSLQERAARALKKNGRGK